MSHSLSTSFASHFLSESCWCTRFRRWDYTISILGGMVTIKRGWKRGVKNHWILPVFQPLSQALSPLPLFVVGRKTLVAAGHVNTCDTNFSQQIIFVDLNWSRRKAIAGHIMKPHIDKCTFESPYSKLYTGETKYICMYPVYWRITDFNFSRWNC